MVELAILALGEHRSVKILDLGVDKGDDLINIKKACPTVRFNLYGIEFNSVSM